MVYTWTALATASAAILYMGNHAGYPFELTLIQSYIVSIVYAVCAILALAYAMARVEYRLF